MGRRTSFLPCLALFLAAGAQGDVFKCKGADGQVLISSEPCLAGSRTETVRPSENLTLEQRLRAEQERDRQQRYLADRESLRAAEALREQASRQKQAEEESARLNQCLHIAQRETDTQLRANLIAACQGVAPTPVVMQQPVLVPVYPLRRHGGPWSPTPKIVDRPAGSERRRCSQVGGN